MRFSMMPSASRRMQNFMKLDSGTNGHGSPRRSGVAAARATTPAPGGYDASQPALQSPVHLVSSRQAVAQAAMLPLPSTGRFAVHNSGQSYPPISNQHAHSHAMQRTRTNSENSRDIGGKNNEAIWEDSTVASMFEETDSRATSERAAKAQPMRRASETTPEQYPQRYEGGFSRGGEHLPFVIAENGTLRVVDPAASARNTTLQGRVKGNNQSPEAIDISRHGHHHSLDVTPTKPLAIHPKRMPHRDTRVSQRRSFAEREMSQVQAEGNATREPDFASETDSQGVGDLVEELLGVKDRQHELQAQRSTVFHDLTPVLDDHAGWSPPDAVLGENKQQAADGGKEGLTPRPSRQSIPVSVAAAQRKASGSEMTLRRSGSNRLEKQPSSRKRRLSLDYDDHQLHSMGQSDLRREAFDFDPKTVALQAAIADDHHHHSPGAQPPPAGGSSLDARLTYHRDRGDSLAQHQFFTSISVDDWEACGDWFLAQFGHVMQRMRAARRAKRDTVRRFEEEIWAHEEGVRTKIESIGRTLGSLRNEGQSLMHGKDVDL